MAEQRKAQVCKNLSPGLGTLEYLLELSEMDWVFFQIGRMTWRS
jgi:hypothetical protein